jgi:hypothetical protein
MADNAERDRAWQQPWLRVQSLLRIMLETKWDGESGCEG